MAKTKNSAEENNVQNPTNPAQQQSTAQDQVRGPEFAIQRIYIKDISFEAPNTPQMFRAEWHPTIQLDIHTKSMPLEANAHEIVLSITVTAKIGETTAFLAEVHQAGIFTINAFPPDQMPHLLWSYCPNILFPFAREVISDLVTRGGFPPFYLAPINFDALYQQHLQKQAKETKESGDVH